MSRSRRRLLKAAAPAQTQPNSSLNPAEAAIAPYPSIDKYPTVLGSSLTLTYLSAVYRIAQTGYRREYVDALDELLERDAHAYSCFATRIVAIAGARIEVEPAACEDEDKEDAKQYANEFRQDFERIENLRQSIASLMWAVYYGVTASEIGWVFEGRVKPRILYWIHSRRIAYPDPNSWNPKIWDLGAVRNWDFLSPTTQGWGIDVYDYPGQFIVHAPQLRGDYPTRDGVGRETAYWSAIKLMAARGAGQFIERFAKPWVVATYNTKGPDDKNPRVATSEPAGGDIAAGQNAGKALGGGNAAAVTLPDSVSLDLKGPGAQSNGSGRLVHGALIDIANKEISKAALGSSDTVETGANGSRSSTSERRKNQIDLNRYDAACLGDTLTRDLSTPWQRFNHSDKPHLRPVVRVYVEDRLTPQEQMELAKDGAGIGMPIDADKLGDAVGLDLLAADAKQGRRLYPVKPIENLKLLNVETEDEEEPAVVPPVAPNPALPINPDAVPPELQS